MKFSIVVPVYNVEKFVERCIKSLMSQTFCDFEIIVIDDGSTDCSVSIIEKIGTDNRLKIISQKNSGTGTARNNGISAAKGEYIVFVDSDDYVDDNLLERMNCVLSNESYDVVLFNSRRVDEKGNLICEFEMCQNLRGKITIHDNPEILIAPTAPWNKVYRSEFIKSNGVRFSEGISFEDTAFSRIALAKAESIYIDGGIYYNYVQRKNSAVNETKIDKMMDIIPANQELINAFYDGVKINYSDEIEYIVISTVLTYILLTINSIDYKRKEQLTLSNFVQARFPDFKENKYLTRRQKKMCKIIESNNYFYMFLRFGMPFRIKRYIKSIL